MILIMFAKTKYLVVQLQIYIMMERITIPDSIQLPMARSVLYIEDLKEEELQTERLMHTSCLTAPLPLSLMNSPMKDRLRPSIR